MSLVVALMSTLLSTAPAEPSADRSLALDFRVENRVTRAVVIEGSAVVSSERSTSVDRRDANNAKASLRLTPRADADNRVTVDLSFDEDGPGGARMSWNGTLAVTRGVAATATIGWGDGGRTLKLQVK